MSFDVLLKLIIVGETGTGKSCLLSKFILDQFKESSAHTIGVEFASKVIQTGNKQVKLQIWDAAGQQRFRQVVRSYYKGAAGALLVYDITSRDSFAAVHLWLDEARKLASADMAIILVGNKSDRDAEREISFVEGATFAHEHGLFFLETSAATGSNVDEVFAKCARAILLRIETGSLDPDRPGSGVQFGDLMRPKGMRLFGSGSVSSTVMTSKSSSSNTRAGAVRRGSVQGEGDEDDHHTDEDSMLYTDRGPVARFFVRVKRWISRWMCFGCA